VALIQPEKYTKFAGLSAAKVDCLEGAVAREIAEGRMPGAVIAIYLNGTAAYQKAFGFRDKAKGVPMTEDTLFWAASMTKPVTVAGILRLAEDGRISLADPIEVYLPEFRNPLLLDLSAGASQPTPAKRVPRIIDLMTHVAGMVEGELGSTPVHRLYYDAFGDGMTDLTGNEFIARLASLPLANEPGDVWHYGFGIDLLGLVIERLTGEKLSDYLEREIFMPLGMRHTTFGVPSAESERYAQPLAADPFTGQAQTLPSLSRARFQSGGAGLVTTAADYLRFAAMLAEGGCFNKVQVLSRKSVELMLADHVSERADCSRIAEIEPTLSGYGFGLGVAVRLSAGGSPVPGTVGDVTWPGSSGATWWASPQDRLAVVCMAHTPGKAKHYYRKFYRSVVMPALL